MLRKLLPAGVFAFVLVFARVGSTVMLLPGIGEIFVSPRIRLSVALLIALVLSPIVAVELPALPSHPLRLVMLVTAEIGIGLFIGAAARIALSGLHVAGTVIAAQSGLGFAQMFDPEQGSQGAAISAFLGLFGLVLIFATDTHLLMLRATLDSYRLFPAAALPPFAGFAEIAVRFVAGSFLLGIQIAAPFIVYGMVFYVGLGLLSRLMPQLQVFFVVVPVQIVTMFIVLAVCLSASGIWFLDYFEQSMSVFLAPR